MVAHALRQRCLPAGGQFVRCAVRGERNGVAVADHTLTVITNDDLEVGERGVIEMALGALLAIILMKDLLLFGAPAWTAADAIRATELSRR